MRAHEAPAGPGATEIVRVVLASADEDVYVLDLVHPDGSPFALVLRRPETPLLGTSVEHVLGKWADATTSVAMQLRPGPRGPVAVMEHRGPDRARIRLDLVA